MSAWKTPHSGAAPSKEELDQRLRADDMSPQWWGNAPGDTYSAHEHGYHKVLYCARGSIVFHTSDGDFELYPGDRLDIEPGTEHAATVGSDGVECVEGHRRT